MHFTRWFLLLVILSNRKRRLSLEEVREWVRAIRGYSTLLYKGGKEIGDCPSLIYSSEGVLPYPQQSFPRDMVQKGFVAVPFCHVKATADWIVFSQTVPTRPNDPPLYSKQVDRWRNLGSRADRSRIRFSYDGSSILSALIRFPVSCCWCGGRRDEVRAIRSAIRGNSYGSLFTK